MKQSVVEQTLAWIESLTVTAGKHDLYRPPDNKPAEDPPVWFLILPDSAGVDVDDDNLPTPDISAFSSDISLDGKPIQSHNIFTVTIIIQTTFNRHGRRKSRKDNCWDIDDYLVEHLVPQNGFLSLSYSSSYTCEGWLPMCSTLSLPDSW